MSTHEDATQPLAQRGEVEIIDWEIAKGQIQRHDPMTVRIEASARNDLAKGYEFYEANEDGLGASFLAFLDSDIESLRIYAGITLGSNALCTGYYPVSFPLRSTVSLKRMKLS